jgi:hypothetical protein
MTEASVSERFVGLLMQLHYTAWVQLGKVAHPVSGKTDRDLEAAKDTIDLLGSLEEKTRGNLHGEEEKLLAHLLLELRMNYVEELKHGTSPVPESATPPASPDSDASAEAQAGETNP